AGVAPGAAGAAGAGVDCAAGAAAVPLAGAVVCALISVVAALSTIAARQAASRNFITGMAWFLALDDLVGSRGRPNSLASAVVARRCRRAPDGGPRGQKGRIVR